MTIAAEQLRTYLEATYPGVRISRLACRDTADGSVSQHSAFLGYDSNALDIMGGPTGWTRGQNIELIQTIVDDVEKHRDEWSIRLILWNVRDHFGHAHFDLWPSCVTAKWCGRNIVPRWVTSTGSYFGSRDPDPENGLYSGPKEGGELMPKQQWEQMIRTVFAIPEIAGGLHGDADWWIALDPDDPQWAQHFWPAMANLWRRET